MQNNQKTSVAFRYARYILILSAIFLISGINIYASQLDIVGPAGSGAFGGTVVSLPNGNIVVVDTTYDAPGPIVDVGAVYLYNGKTGALISTITGSTTLDNIGSSATGITVLANGNFVIRSPNWDNGAVVSSGAVTFCSGTTGCSGVVSAANSLVGSTASDTISSGGVFPLPNNNFIVSSNTTWDNGAATNAGAITFCSGTTGCPIGAVSAANSLIGSTASDSVGTPVILPNSNFVIFASNWDNGASANVGAATFCSGTTGCVGAVSAANSMIGATASDGSLGTSVSVLGNGNYVYRMPGWDNGAATDAGATVFCDGTTGCTPGPVTTANSLYGSTTGDGNSVLINPLIGNNNYVVTTSNWDNGATTNAGAVTWCSGATGCTGPVTTSNSLIGVTIGDAIGAVTQLTNGNYIVSSTLRDNGAITDAGSITWGNGNNGTFGTVTAANSLIGSTINDTITSAASAPLANGNFVTRSTNFDNGAITQAGAISYIPGNAPLNGALTTDNSVIGTVASGGSLLVFSLNPFYETFAVGRPGSNTVTILNPTYSASANGNWSADSTWNYGAFTGMHDVYIPNGRTVNLDSVVMVNSLRVDCTGSTTGASSSAYIIGNIQKDYCAAGGFTYPVGTANGYSPVDASVTALGINPSSLTISANQTVHPTLSASNSLKRYWSLTETGDLTTDLVFHYLDPIDISTLEATYKLYRVSGGMPVAVTPFTLDVGANTISTTGVSNFSDWAVGNAVVVAANVSVGGRVLATNGAGIKNAIVSITDSNGISRTVRTGSFGYYNFDEVEAGRTYIVSVASKRFVFANPTQVITVNDNIGDLDFIAQPQLRSEGGKLSKEN